MSMITPTQPPTAAAELGYTLRKARALIGWLPHKEGALWLAGRQMRQPAESEHLERCKAATDSVAARPPGVDQASLFAELPPSVLPHIEALKANPISARVLANAGKPVLVDLTRICAMQPQIHIEDAVNRTRGLREDDYLAIAKITLPLPVAEPLPLAFDVAKNAWIFSSPNSNLTVAGNFSAPVGGGMHGFGFVVAMQNSAVQVAGLNGRYFLLDGYHRAYGLLAVGIRFVPAFIKDFGSFEELKLPHGVLPQAAYLGERPPLLGDYLDDRVAADTMIPITQKVIVVQALEISSIG